MQLNLVKGLSEKRIADLKKLNINTLEDLSKHFPKSYLDLTKIEKVLNKLCLRLNKELPHLKGEVELLGINSIEPSSLRYRMTVLTEPTEQYGVQRIMRKEIKLELDKNGIKLPYNQVVMHNRK